MKNMMKILSMILFFGMMISFSACEKEEPAAGNENPAVSSGEEESKADTDTPYINGWTADIERSDFETEEEYEEAFLTEWTESLEPGEVFETESEYPLVIREIFEIITEKEGLYSRVFVNDIWVFGDENEFYVHYGFIAEMKENHWIDDDGHMMIRVGKNEEGRYCLLASGGGAPVSYGLEESGVTVEEIWQGDERTREEALAEWAENLEPIEIFDTKKVFPEVIGEIFDVMMEKEPEERKAKTIKMAEVYGGENEFFVHYRYSSESSDFGNLRIRVRMNNDGLYTLVAEGEGPIYFGLEKNNIKLAETGLE